MRRRLLDGIDKEQAAGWRFIEHTVSISVFMVRLELALRGRTDVRIVEKGEILEDAPKTNRDRMVKLEASIRLGGALRKNANVPDALFGLRLNDEEESYFMLEIDRGEMPVERYKNAASRPRVVVLRALKADVGESQSRSVTVLIFTTVRTKFFDADLSLCHSCGKIGSE